jgi:hypothetical protein
MDQDSTDCVAAKNGLRDIIEETDKAGVPW